MVGKYTRHFGDAFLLGSEDTTVSCDNTEVTVDDDGIDEAKLTKRGAEFVYLLRRMRPGIVYIGYELRHGDELHFSRCFHHTRPHSANFSKPPAERMYSLAVSTISE